MPRYNHAVSLAFSVISNDPEGEDITPDMIKEALYRRVIDLDSAGDLEWLEATCPPWDTYEEE